MTLALLSDNYGKGCGSKLFVILSESDESDILTCELFLSLRVTIPLARIAYVSTLDTL